jgi:hypothetical protein
MRLHTFDAAAATEFGGALAHRCQAESTATPGRWQSTSIIEDLEFQHARGAG